MPEAQRGLAWFSKELIEVLPAAVYICDMDAIVVAFNKRAIELWGRTPNTGESEERFCGAHKLFLPDGTALPHCETPMAAVLRTGQPASDQEVVIERPDGSRVTVLVNIKPLFDKEGVQVGAVNCFQDLTAQRAAEDERTTLREEARHGQKLKAMGHLVGGVAHDFNNLLTPILGNLDMLRRREPRDAREIRQIDGALQAAERAKTLVQRLLAFARRQPLKPDAIDMAALVTGMKDLIASATGPQIDLMFDIAANLPPAMIDGSQIEMAILNLSVNARDAMPNGGVLTITVAAEAVGAVHRGKLSPGRYIRLTIADTGSGMDQATLNRAIEPFFSTKGIGQGTGLGLSMVDGLVSQLGGGLTLTSTPGRGTQVALLLPISVRTVANAAVAHVSRSDVDVIGRLLLVDDEDLVRTSTADMLTDLGYQVIEANSADAALAYLDKDPHVSGIITDHLMPGMTGVELSRLVRARSPGMPVLIISGYADAEAIAVNQPLLAKPFRQADLAASLADLLRQTVERKTGRRAIRA